MKADYRGNSNSLINEKGKNREEIDAMEVAEDARETQWEQPSFVAELFMGSFRPESLLPYPDQDPEDRRVGDAFIEKLNRFMDEKLDPDRIDREKRIPDDVMKGLADLGAFGIKIPKEYGGLGFSQTNYARVLAQVSGRCGSTAVTLSAHQSIGVPQPLIMFGTEEQKKKYLPRFCKGEVSAFALTEPDVGSDPARLSTTATPDGDHYIINGTKLWCTNGAIADILVVMAQTPPVVVNGREKKQITAFIVEKNAPGFEVLHRCDFMGLKGIQNALLKFTNVRVPKENILWGLGKGLKLALITLNTGRISIPAGCVGGGRVALRESREWANERKQWGATIGQHEPGAQKLASMSANLLAMEAVTWLVSQWVDRKSQDIRLEAAMSKLFCSLRLEHIVQEALQLRGGRGYETADSLKARGEKALPVERWVRDARINQIVEGTNEILRLFIAREALDRHLAVAGDVLNAKLPIARRLLGVVKAGLFYAVWYPKQWIGGLNPFAFGELGILAPQMRYVSRTSRRLARATFHLMLLNGPKLEKRQLQLGRVVDIATELFAMAATIGKARGRMPQAADCAHIEEAAQLFCWEARTRIERSFDEISENHDGLHRQMGKRVSAGEMTWQEEIK